VAFIKTIGTSSLEALKEASKKAYFVACLLTCASAALVDENLQNSEVEVSRTSKASVQIIQEILLYQIGLIAITSIAHIEYFQTREHMV
jgi:uncharacterized membrane protein YiaA